MWLALQVIPTPTVLQCFTKQWVLIEQQSWVLMKQLYYYHFKVPATLPILCQYGLPIVVYGKTKTAITSWKSLPSISYNLHTLHVYNHDNVFGLKCLPELL